MKQWRQPKFAVGIPARNEQVLIESSIASVLCAADELTDPKQVRVVVACDSCTDATPRLARDIGRADTRVEVIEGTWQSAGGSRGAALLGALELLGDRTTPSDIWLATTDADTVVPSDWLTLQAGAWAHGDHAIAGIVDLLEDEPAVKNLFARHYVLGRERHGHVHGANLGIRADAYLAVGGFPPIPLAEDHALWQALRAAGFRCRPSVSLRVATSGRLSGRATGGFADTLRTLISEIAPHAPEQPVTA